jgi:hypothetical protein
VLKTYSSCTRIMQSKWQTSRQTWSHQPEVEQQINRLEYVEKSIYSIRPTQNWDVVLRLKIAPLL